MDSMVLKYIAWTLLSYGFQAMFALMQLLLCAYLIIGGLLQLSYRENVGKWGGRFGLTANPEGQHPPLLGWLMMVSGALLVLPILVGAPHWASVVASAAALGLIWVVSRASGEGGQRTGSMARRGLIVFSLLVFGLTLWEGKDLVVTAKSVVSKAAYWRHKEVEGWQKTNNPNVPKIGEEAPDFNLFDHTGLKTVQLSGFRGKKPVVLVFGSFT
jgi:hypothetical protein